MASFDPTHFGFVLLADFQFPVGVDVFEYRNHPAVTGVADVLRINLYLSRDADFVTIWSGLIEPTMVEGLFELTPPIPDLDFERMYGEHLFRGYIESDEIAAIILKSLRYNDGRYGVPHVLAGAPHDLRCETLPA